MYSLYASRGIVHLPSGYEVVPSMSVKHAHGRIHTFLFLASLLLLSSYPVVKFCQLRNSIDANCIKIRYQRACVGLQPCYLVGLAPETRISHLSFLDTILDMI